MLLTKYDPIFDLAHSVWGNTPDMDAATHHNLVPQVDVITKKDGWTFLFDLPGTKQKDVTIEIESGQLVVSGERHADKTTEDKSYIFSERSYGKFQRRFVLPDSVDTEGVTAAIKDGVLEIHFGKIPEVQSRRIEIKEH